MTKLLADLVQPHLVELHPYVPGDQPQEEGWIKLNTNELPYSPPESVRKAIFAELDALQRYPNPTSARLREGIARFHQLVPDQVIVGNGSDDILNLLAQAFGGPLNRTAESFPSYSLYPVLTAISGGRIQSIPLGEAFSLPVRELLAAEADLLFLTCPNAPSGVCFPLEQLEELAAGCPGILVIDEAYAEFASRTAIPLLNKYENLVITRTFSKAYGLAGLRVGYGLSSPGVIRILDCIRDSYNVNRLSQAGALAALESQCFYEDCISEIKRTREQVKQELRQFGWEVYPSETNFLFAGPVRENFPMCCPEGARSLFDWLLAHRVLIRYFPKHPLTASFLRITIGTPSEMELFLDQVRKWTTCEQVK